MWAAERLDDPTIAVTIFAPTDVAFDEFLATQNWTLFDLLDSDYLTSIMEYHVVPAPATVFQMTVGGAMLPQLFIGEVLPTLFEGQNLTISAPLVSASALTVNAEDSFADIIVPDVTAGEVRAAYIHNC